MLTLDEANRVIAAAVNYAREHGYRVSVSVCDTSGYPVAHQRMDGALPMSPHYSIAKAVTSAGFGIPSEEELTADVRALPIATAVATGMPLSRVRGGIPLIRNGQVVGGIGVDSSPSFEADEDCAKHAVEAAGFSGTPRQH
jgi:glc operon protein GlcG